MKRRDLLQHFGEHGCVLLREGARHSWWHNITNGRRSAVPRHTEVQNMLVRKICRDLGISEPIRF